MATFGAVRSSNRSARVAEQALREQRRPLLVQARLDDPPQKIMFAEGHWARTDGNRAEVAEEDGIVFLAVPVRNIGSGIAVLRGWYVWARRPRADDPHPPLDAFREHTRDNYVPPNDVGLWQGALRDPEEDVRVELDRMRDRRELFGLDVLYTDQVGGQRTISRFAIAPAAEDQWLASVVRHWNLDESVA